MNSWQKALILTQLLLQPSKTEMITNLALMGINVYTNSWNEVAWFGTSILPNLFFEIWYAIDLYKDMPD